MRARRVPQIQRHRASFAHFRSGVKAFIDDEGPLELV